MSFANPSLGSPSFANPSIGSFPDPSTANPFPARTVHVVDAESSLEKYDHIIVPFPIAVPLRGQEHVAFHHGIWLGRGEDGKLSVLDFTTHSGITIRKFIDFMNSQSEVIVGYHEPEDPMKVEARVQMAFADGYPKGYTYDVLDNNCEHFAYWIKTGRCTSNQTDNLPRLVRYLTKNFVQCQAYLGRLAQSSASSFASRGLKSSSMGSHGTPLATFVEQMKEKFTQCGSESSSSD